MGKIIRCSIDIAMTVATLVLMGGNYFFESTAVHEILGVVLLVLWAVHITLNRRFFLSFFRCSRAVTTYSASCRWS